MGLTNNRTKARVTGSANARSSEIEFLNSPNTRHVDDNASSVFSAFVFVVVLAVVTTVGYLLTGEINIWVLCAGLVFSIISIFTLHIASQWERDVILRFGAFDRMAGPGLYFTIPFVEHVALKADLRTMLTGFSAEEILTSDLVPINVDAAIFWMIWDAEKACLEVENYYDAVSMAAQTALRDAIGRNSLTDVTVHRDKLDQELRDKIEEKTNSWGVSIMSVEIRDIVIPKDLQDAMAAAAKAEREKDARIVLAEVEKDVAAMLHDATDIYKEDEIAFKLRQMHLVNQSLRESGSSLVVPSAYAEGFTEKDSGKTFPTNK